MINFASSKRIIMATLANSGANNLADSPTFHQNTTGFVQHINVDSSNPFYTTALSGLSVQSIAVSGDNATITFDAGDDISTVMKFSQLELINTTVVNNRSNDGKFEIISADNTSKEIVVYAPQAFAQAAAGGTANVNPLRGANYVKCYANATFTSFVEDTDFVSGDADMIETVGMTKGDEEFGVFTEIVVSAGSLRVALI